MDSDQALAQNAHWLWPSVALGLLFVAGILTVVLVLLSGRRGRNGASPRK